MWSAIASLELTCQYSADAVVMVAFHTGNDEVYYDLVVRREESICLEMQVDNDPKQELPFVLTAAIGGSEPFAVIRVIASAGAARGFGPVQGCSSLTASTGRCRAAAASIILIDVSLLTARITAGDAICLIGAFCRKHISCLERMA
ncbi:MAG: hypothetical protein Q4P24_03360 [Rhodobacterales bacterium]|nr:hypothetical protein [Rhodobacterales bacterium]